MQKIPEGQLPPNANLLLLCRSVCLVAFLILKQEEKEYQEAIFRASTQQFPTCNASTFNFLSLPFTEKVYLEKGSVFQYNIS